jgi:hypothetical protein
VNSLTLRWARTRLLASLSVRMGTQTNALPVLPGKTRSIRLNSLTHGPLLMTQPSLVRSSGAVTRFLQDFRPKQNQSSIYSFCVPSAPFSMDRNAGCFCSDYFPFHRGCRFSIKALTPSRASSVVHNLVMISLLSVNLCRKGISIIW